MGNKKMAFWLLLLTMIFFTIPVNAESLTDSSTMTETKFIPAKATAYCLPGTMANGQKVHLGACAGANKYFGKTVVMFKRLPDNTVGDYIGTYTVEDKGGTKGIKQGYVIDVWQPDLNACHEFMNLVYEDGCKGNIYIIVKEEKDYDNI